jgi:NAD(P)-dependent dehydrogenase (short-subunit alcohol dehydrogenase family)
MTPSASASLATYARRGLKPLSDQVVVILGASSGIGRITALRCAARGAKLVVAARSEPGLRSLVDEIAAKGGEAVPVVCDIADVSQVNRAAEVAVETYGRIDTWVNVAAAAVYATFEATTIDEFRRVIDVNLMGYVHGAKAALPHLRREGRGALIFVSSVEGRVAMPLQSAYATSKHAIEGMVDAVRRELMAEGIPISVSSVKPAGINTPFFNNALSKIGFRPTVPPPIYQPAIVADCILYAAEHPVRDLYAGGAGRMMTLWQAAAPGLLDRALARFGHSSQHTDDPPGPGALYAPRLHDNRIEGDFGDQAFAFSPYTWLQTHPGARAMLAISAVAVGTFRWLATSRPLGRR